MKNIIVFIVLTDRVLCIVAVIIAL